MKPWETYEHAGVRVELHYDEDPSWSNPRDCDNVTTFVCWHPDYILGDYQIRNPEGRGAVGQIFETDRGQTEFRSMRVLHRYITLMLKGRRVTPLYLYDHSGISMSAGSPSMTWMDPQGWDTTMVGFAFCTDEQITKICGPEHDHAEYHADEWIDEAIKIDVGVYDQYLRGEVYGYVVAPGTEDEESCWGFLGDDYVREAANADADCVAVRVAERERVRRLYLMAPETMVA